MNMTISPIIRLIKKLSFLLILPLTLHATNTDYSIVFVHIGNRLPSYLPYALEQARLFNPDAPIYLIANKQAITVHKAINLDAITLVTCEELQPSKAHKQFTHTATLDTSFRDGFWKKTTERFFYLEELMQAHNLTNVFHLEYDNMLYVNLADLLPLFQRHYKGIAAIFDNEDRCVPNFMYIAHPSHAALLVNYLTVQAPQGAQGRHIMGFDMNTIGSYRKTSPNTSIDSLPIIPQAYAHHTPLQKPVQQPQLFYNHIDVFNSIFDGAALGQFLGGIDPRNGPSLPGFVNQDCVFNASHFSYVWLQDEHGRKIPYLEYDGNRYRINNLHIHSKQLDKFRS